MPEALYAAALLACPIGMGAMMWMMGRGHKSQPGGPGQPVPRAEVAALQAQVDQLLAAQRDRTGGSADSGSSSQGSLG